MAKLNPEEYAIKQATRLKASVPDIRRGIERVTTAPGVLAAKQQEKMKNNLLKSIDDGTWAKRVAGVTLSEWQEKTLEKGLNRIASGIDASYDSQVMMAGNLLREIDNAKAAVDKMPKVTLEDSIARMTTFVRKMHASKGKIKANS